MRIFLAVLLLAVAAWAQTDEVAFYQATLIQAAPGKLTGLLDQYKSQFAKQKDAPLWMRHSQGDFWDLLILTPLAHGYADLHHRPAGDDARRDLIAREEDVFVFGPPVATVRAAFTGAGFFHVEMFHALAGQRAELIKERGMENAYAAALKQPTNLIFVRDSGAAWDVFTIGCFRDLKHYSESADVTPEQANAAARAAGFAASSDIGPYLRRFIASHHDTLAVAVK